MIDSSSTFQTRQLSLGRKPEGKLLIKDYSLLSGNYADDTSNNIIGSSAQNALAVKFTPSQDMTVDHLKLFLKSDTSTNQDITVEVRESSASVPAASAISNGDGVIFSFTDTNPAFRKAHFANNFSLSSGTDYWVVAYTTGSTYSYYWAEDENFTGGEWRVDAGNDGSWGAANSDKTLIFKAIEINVAETETITGLTSSGSIGIIEVSGASWTASAYEGRLATMSASGASGDRDKVKTSFVITSNTATSFVTDLNPVSYGLTVGDTIQVESLNNFVEVTDLISFGTDDQRDRTINVAMAEIYNDKGKFFDSHPHGDTLRGKNEAIIQIAFSGTEFIPLFRGSIEIANVKEDMASVEFQDVMGKFQRIPINFDAASIDYEDVIARICQRVDVPFVVDPTGEVTASSTSFNDGSLAIDVAHKLRQSLSFRLYGDPYGRVRFRERQTASQSVFDIGQDDFILRKGLKWKKSQKETLNVIGATNVEDGFLSKFSSEVLIGSFASGAADSNKTITFASAGVYGNLRWEDAVNNGSVYIEEQGDVRNTGKTSSGTGSMKFTISAIASSLNYDIRIYGAPINVSGTQFYVEKSDGQSINEIGQNTTKTIIQNDLFLSASFTEETLDRILLSNGKSKARPTLKCRGIATLEVEDPVTVDHSDIDSSIFFNTKGLKRNYENGSFTTEVELEDTLVRSDDKRYDIGLRYDQGLRYD